MQSFLAKCVALGIVAGGFAITGDLGRLADRGRALLDATGVPTDAATQAMPATSPAAGVAATPSPVAHAASAPAIAPPADSGRSAPSGAVARVWSLPGEAPADAPVGQPVAPPPSSGGVDAVDLRQLVAGGRVLVWVRRPGASALGRSDRDLIALDIIDPTSGEALVHRHAAVGERSPSHAAPRRVVVAADRAGRIARGDTLRLAPIRGVNGTGAVEEIGRVLALDTP